MTDRKHIILYSHGFGVDKTGRGIFTDIATSIPDAEHVMFDYNQYDQDGNMTITPLDEQVELLTEQLDDLPGESTIDIVAHSQGCIVTALAKPDGIRNIVLLAPPTAMNKDRMLAWFGKRKGAVINPEGTTTIPRRDGSTSIITPKYWGSIADIDVMKQYKRLAQEHNVIVVRAQGDEVVGETDFSPLEEFIKLVEFEADHNFTGQSRSRLCQKVREML